MSSENKLRELICTVGQSLYQRGYVVGTAGNISVQLDDGWLITPTDACLGRLDPGLLPKVNHAGHRVSGSRPSKTLTLHRCIYQNDPEARAVIHTHSTHLVALTLKGVWNERDVLPPITPYFVMKVGHVPLIPYYRPGDPEAQNAVVQQIAHFKGKLRAVLLARLGPIVWHTGVMEAAYALEELEETARLWMMLERASEPLARAQVEELCNEFGARW